MKCPNCNSVLVAKYCAQCGQKQGELIPSLGSLVTAAWGDFFILDVKIFKTIKEILFFPSRYIDDFFAGRRRRYVSPFPLYLMTFALSFFLMKVLELKVLESDPVKNTIAREEAPYFCFPDDPELREIKFVAWLCTKEKTIGYDRVDQAVELVTDIKLFEILVPFLGSLFLFTFWWKKKKKFIEHFFFLVTSLTAINLVEIFIQLAGLVSVTIRTSYLMDGFAYDFSFIIFRFGFTIALSEAIIAIQLSIQFLRPIFFMLYFGHYSSSYLSVCCW